MQIIDLREFAPDPEQCFYSTGDVCQHLQITPSQLRVLMEATGVRFSRIDSGKAFLNFPAFEKINDASIAVKSEITKAKSAVPNN